MSGFWNYTYCIHCEDLELIEQALTQILEQEGCRRIPLPPLSIDIEELRRYPWHLCRDLWISGLFVSAPEWTIVKMLPEELLCRRAQGTNRPRLSELAMQIGNDAFYLGVYEYGGILMEADARGGIFISGSIGPEYSEEGKFFDEQINLQEYGRFFLLDVPEEMQRAKRLLQAEQNQRFERWEEQFLENYARQNFPLLTSNQLEHWKARFKEDKHQLFAAEGGEQLFDAWAGEGQHLIESCSRGFKLFDQALARLLDPTHSYWYLHNLAYYAYAREIAKVEPAVDPAHADEINPLTGKPYREREYEIVSRLTENQLKRLKQLLVEEYPQQLETDGARLLYFQPAEQYLQPDAGQTRSATSDGSSMDTESDLDDIPFVRPVNPKTLFLGLQDSWEYEANRPPKGYEWCKF